MRIGIIDLGTNTFNLLIADKQDDQPFKCLLNTKSAVMLGSEGLDKGFISDKAFTRAYGVLRDFRALLNEFNCNKVIAFGTSAIRSASNAIDFIGKVSTDLNINIEPITGDKEAEYIYLGVKQAVDFTSENFLILDIGGGSNEFIIANKHKLLWKHSFPLGGARLHERFKPCDPIKESEIEKINIFLKAELVLLEQALKQFPITKLVGSSGAFDSFSEIIHYKKNKIPLPINIINSKITLADFDMLYEMIINSSRSERLLIQGLEALRVDSIVMASLFTKLSIQLSGASEIIQSAYSLKEGVISTF